MTLRCLLFLPAFLIALPAQAVVFPDKPPSEDFFVDEAGLITVEDKAAINSICKALLEQEKIPVFVVTIPSLASMEAGDYTIEKYAYELFNEWGIGFKDRDYGMLLIVAKIDRKARIELGTGWGHSSNLDAQKVMNDLIIPQFKQNDHSAGIRKGVEGMDAMARGIALPKPERPKQPWWVIPLLIAFLVLVGVVAYSLFKSGRTGWGWAFLVGVGAFLLFLFFILQRLSESSGGSSGGFGGGSSGGGGASGSW